jgi:hypothetical protein
MDQTLLTVMTVFVILAAVSMMVQAAVCIGLFIAFRRLQEKIVPLIPQAKGILETSQQVLQTSHQVLHTTQKFATDISARAISIADLSKEQVVKVDELLTDVSARAKVQMERAEMVLDDSMGRAQQTVVLVQRGLLKPVKEVHGILSGFRAALSFLGRSGRPTVDHATADEEMFI